MVTHDKIFFHKFKKFDVSPHWDVLLLEINNHFHNRNSSSALSRYIMVDYFPITECPQVFYSFYHQDNMSRTEIQTASLAGVEISNDFFHGDKLCKE